MSSGLNLQRQLRTLRPLRDRSTGYSLRTQYADSCVPKYGCGAASALCSHTPFVGYGRKHTNPCPTAGYGLLSRLNLTFLIFQERKDGNVAFRNLSWMSGKGFPALHPLWKAQLSHQVGHPHRPQMRCTQRGRRVIHTTQMKSRISIPPKAKSLMMRFLTMFGSWVLMMRPRNLLQHYTSWRTFMPHDPRCFGGRGLGDMLHPSRRGPSLPVRLAHHQISAPCAYSLWAKGGGKQALAGLVLLEGGTLCL